MGRIQSATETIMSRVGVVFQFLTSQGVTLLGNMVYGLLCVRLLSTSEYAKFVVLFATLGSLVNLMDVNFSGSLIPLIGLRVDDRKLIADYVASLRRMSLWLFAGMGLITVFAYPRLVSNRGWDRTLIVEMVLLLLVACWFIRISAAYGAVMVLLRDRVRWYRGQLISSLGTLALLLILWETGLLTGLAAIVLNVAGVVFVGAYYYFCATQALGVRGTASKEKQSSIIRLALPNVPYSIFYALQGQIALFLIIIFGRTTGVASVGALGRLSQMFALLIQTNPLLVEPYFARLPKDRLLKNYFAAIAIVGGLCLAITLLSAQFAGLFLWVLGPQYQGYHREVLLVIASSAIAALSDLLWTIHAARRFVYWMNNVMNISLILIVQILFITHADLSSVRAVLWLSLATNSATLVVNSISGVFGFIRGPREVEKLTPPTPEAAIEANAFIEQVDTFGFRTPDHQ